MDNAVAQTLRMAERSPVADALDQWQRGIKRYVLIYDPLIRQAVRMSGANWTHHLASLLLLATHIFQRKLKG